MRCGVLGLQGDWSAHRKVLTSLGVEDSTVVRTADELTAVDGLVMPGGESTAIYRLLRDGELVKPLTRRIVGGMPVLATCAGVILLAREILPHGQPSLAVLDVSVERNAYGRQVASTVDTVALVPKLGAPATIEGVFIRAPRITALGPGVHTLGTWHDDPVLVQADNILAATFHPELTHDTRIHELFLEM